MSPFFESEVKKYTITYDGYDVIIYILIANSTYLINEPFCISNSIVIPSLLVYMVHEN